MLVDPQGVALPEWLPGSHIEIQVTPPGQGAIVLQYSLFGDPADLASYRVAVLLEHGGEAGNRFLHEHVRNGQLECASHPRTLFPFTITDRMVFVAGGIGITPILPMIVSAERAGSYWILHSCRSGDRIDAVQRCAGCVRLACTPLHVVRGGAASRRGRGREASGAPIYACGPSRLLVAVQEAATKFGAEVHVERFINDQPVALKPDPTFEVELSLSRKTFSARPGDPFSIGQSSLAFRFHHLAAGVLAVPARALCLKASLTIAAPSSTRRSEKSLRS